MKEKKHIPTSDELFAWKSPFTALKNVTLPSTRTPAPARDLADKTSAAPKRNRGQVDILCSTAHPRILTNAGFRPVFAGG